MVATHPTDEDATSMPYAEAASHRADVRSWHGRAALGCVGIATVAFLASVVAGEAGTIAYYFVNLAVMAALWAVLRTRPQRSLLMIWPLLIIVGLLVASFFAPKTANLCQGTIVIGFLFCGVTQRRGMSLLLWPVALVAAWCAYDLPVGQTIVRLFLATAVWLSVAELPAWLTDRLGATQNELARAAHTDALTGLPNRRAWQEHLEHIGDGDPLTLFLIDLDHFKRYNDEHGHLAGDELLIGFADSLRAQVRAGDLVSRWGGEEFAIALPGAQIAEGRAVADRILSAVPDGQSCSIGMAELRPGERLESLMARADAALYRAKDAGRNRVVAA